MQFTAYDDILVDTDIPGLADLFRRAGLAAWPNTHHVTIGECDDLKIDERELKGEFWLRGYSEDLGRLIADLRLVTEACKRVGIRYHIEVNEPEGDDIVEAFDSGDSTSRR